MITAKRLSFIMYLLLGVLVAGSVVLTVYTNSWLASKANRLVSVKLETASLEEKQKADQDAKLELEKYKTTQTTLEKIIPKDKDQAKTIGELLTIAKEVDVTINTITFPASELGSTKSSQTVAGTTPAAGASTITQAKSVDNIPGLLGIEVTISQIDRKGGESGSGMTYGQLINFLESIEKNRRTMQIKTIQIQPLKSSSGVSISGYSLTLTMNIFVKP